MTLHLVPPVVGLTIGLIIWGIGEGLIYLAWWMGHRATTQRGPGSNR